MTPDDIRRLANWANDVAFPDDASLTEAMKRVTVGRAYYSAFLQVRAHMRHRTGDPKMLSTGPATHAALLAVLRGVHSTNHDQDIADELESLFGRRKTADYELQARRVWEKEANDAVEQAKEIFRLTALQ
ncbi:MAG: HEPN domain-containing protein [Nannocystaceae bacterium]|nr:HEPN domain-containing protein [Nannocystaceae bacterium]